MQLTSDLGNGVCDQFALYGVVLSSKDACWTADNIDYNPSATTAKILLEISFMQQPSHEFEGSNFYIQ